MEVKLSKKKNTSTLTHANIYNLLRMITLYLLQHICACIVVVFVIKYFVTRVNNMVYDLKPLLTWSIYHKNTIIQCLSLSLSRLFSRLYVVLIFE